MIRLAGLLICLGCASVACGQDYPNKPVRIVTSNVGGSNDIVARLVAQALTRRWGQQVIVDNRPTGPISGEVVAHASPDGYTLLVFTNSFYLGPLMQKAPYDPVKDFAPVTITTRAPNIMVVHPSLPAKSIKELIALAKAKPGVLNYASGPNGGGSHLAVELFKHLAGVDIVRVAYKGGAAALIGLLAGETQMTIDDAPTLIPNVKLGKVVALAVTTTQPSPFYPSLPTVAASVPGYEYSVIQGVFVPAKAPATLVKRLNQEIVRVVNEADSKEKFSSLGLEVVGNSPDEVATTLKAEMERMGKVMANLGLRAN